MSVTASDWAYGIGYSVLASIIGGASKLCIRKSWLMVQGDDSSQEIEINDSTFRDNQDDCNIETSGSYESPARTGRRRESSSSQDSDSFDVGDQERSPMSLVDAEIDHDDGNEERDRPTQAQNESSCTSTKKNRLAIFLRLSGMFGMTFLNPLFCVLAMNYASPSILAPFSGLTLVWIVLFSESMIGEKPSRYQVLAAYLIIFGEVLVAIFGDHTNDEGMTVQDVVSSYQAPLFQFYFVMMLAWIFALSYIMIKRPTRNPFLKRFAWGVSGGSITGFQNFLKDSLTIIKASNESGESFPILLYIFAFFAILSSFGGLLFLTACMKRYDATFSSAMFVGSFVISASIMSAMHYNTFSNLEGIWNWIMYPLGLIILMIGVKMLVNATSESEMICDDEIVRRDSDNSSGSEESSSARNPLISEREII